MRLWKTSHCKRFNQLNYQNKPLFMRSMITLFCLLSLSTLAFSILPVQKPTLRLNNYSIKEGLSHPGVLQIKQDDNGYIWIATEDGLNRFDGKNFVNFFANPKDQFSINRSMISSLFKDTNGRIWLGSKNGLSYIDKSGQKFIDLKLDFNGDNPFYIMEITAAENNNLWLLGLHSLWHFDQHSFKLTKINNINNAQVNVNIGSIENFYGVDDGSLIVGNREGIYALSNRATQAKKIPNFPGLGKEIKKIRVVDGVIWVVTRNHIYQFNNENNKWQDEVFDENVSDFGFLDIVADHHKMWAASSNGLWLKEPSCNCWISYHSDQLVNNSLPSNRLANVFLDSQSQLWIGTEAAGISVRNPKSQIIKHWLNRRQTANFLNDATFSSISVTDFKSSNDGGYSVATDFKGIFQLSRQGQIQSQLTTENTPQMLSNDINQVYVDVDNNLWMASLVYGLQVRLATGSWSYLKGKKWEYIFEIYEDRNSEIWLGTLGGAYQAQINKKGEVETTLRAYPKSVMLHGPRTNVIYQSKNGLYWFGTEAGLIVMDENFKTIKVFTESAHQNPILNNAVNDITEGASGNIWIATGAGINKISKLADDWQVSTIEDEPLLNNKTLVMVETDSVGQIWTAGSHGLFSINPTTQQVTFFSEKTGVQGLEFALDGSFVDAKGNLYFGGSNGVSVIPSGFNTNNNHNSPLHFSDLRINGFEVENSIPKLQDGSYFIPANTKIARLYFDVVNLDSTSAHSIRIRIPKFSEKWLPWKTEAYFDLLELPAGMLTIQVQAKNLSTSRIIADDTFKLKVESNFNFYDYSIWILFSLFGIGLLIYLRKQNNRWDQEKELLIKSQLKLSETISVFKNELDEKNQQQEQLLDELAASIKENTLLENQINDLHLVDKQTGLHTKEFISLSIDVLTRKILDSYQSQNEDRRKNIIPEPLLFIIKLDKFESLRLEGGQFLINQMVIQIASEIKKVCVNTDELVKWNKDSFLLYSRNEPVQQVLGKCKKIIKAINKGLFGPSDSEKLSVTATVSVIKYPFLNAAPDVFAWPVLLDLAYAGGCYLSQQGGNSYQFLSENPNHKLLPITLDQMEQCIDDFSVAIESHWIEILN